MKKIKRRLFTITLLIFILIGSSGATTLATEAEVKAQELEWDIYVDPATGDEIEVRQFHLTTLYKIAISNGLIDWEIYFDSKTGEEIEVRQFRQATIFEAYEIAMRIDVKELEAFMNGCVPLLPNCSHNWTPWQRFPASSPFYPLEHMRQCTLCRDVQFSRHIRVPGVPTCPQCGFRF